MGSHGPEGAHGAAGGEVQCPGQYDIDIRNVYFETVFQLFCAILILQKHIYFIPLL